MKLFYSPGACSLAIHIALLEAGVTAELAKVDLKTHRVEDGTDFYLVNSGGYVPALQIDEGTVLTEAAALLQYVGELVPHADLLPARGLERAQTLSWLTFVATELHKGFSPWLFRPGTAPSTIELAEAKLAKHFEGLNRQLSTKHFLTGKYSIADIYAFTVLSWTAFVGISLEPYSAIQCFMHRVSSRPQVRNALVAEGLVEAG